ncbi:hypothetical protein AZ78_2620 [Lysobacter capsici AZ78]|uniref:Uncharacterized protein n=1 Tax=Lysobacter capsici AZ78 TaxID=1444315 RepID=A0A108U9J4_9GAMM|nr:hypothetical protein AZ78_2620 [Lysobacter capsici AZ78]
MGKPHSTGRVRRGGLRSGSTWPSSRRWRPSRQNPRPGGRFATYVHAGSLQSAPQARIVPGAGPAIGPAAAAIGRSPAIPAPAQEASA